MTKEIDNKLSISGRWMLGIAAPMALLAAVALARPAAATEIAIPNYTDAFAAYPFLVAIEGGFMKKHGVDITDVRNSFGGTTEVRSMVAGDLPFAQTTIAPIMNAIAQGADLKIVMETVHSSSPTVFMTRKDAPINSLADLKGKKLAFSTPQSATQILDLLLLDKAGLTQNDVTLVAAGSLGAQTTLLDNGGVDVVVFAEPLYTQNKDKYKVVARVGDIMPAATSSLGITSSKVIKEQPDFLRNLIAARAEAVDFMNTNRAEAASIIAKKIKLDVSIVRPALDNTIDNGKSGSLPYYSHGELAPEAIDRAVDQQVKIGTIAKGVDTNWRAHTDQSFLPAKDQVKF